MDFRIIALKPLNECNENIRKVIKPGIIYYFYNNYKISARGIQYYRSIPDDFFSKGKPSINISAVVGKNGSGKSSLIDLLIACINNLSYFLKITPDTEIELVPDLKVELYFQSNNYYKIVLKETVTIYEQEESSDHFIRINFKDLDPKNFFFSIVSNYSHYGLNSKEVGNWINSLFHKNDGYQTPIVLNPKRKDGNIDINSESALTESRLMANILRPAVINSDDELLITENALADKIQLQLIQGNNWVIYENRRNVRNSFQGESKGSFSERTSVEKVTIVDLKDDLDKLLKEVNRVYNFGFKGKWESGDHVASLAHSYIIRKLVKIAVTYPFYSQYFDREKRKFKERKFNEFLLLLFSKNENHISFKLKQTLNFLKYRHIEVRDHRIFFLEVRALAKKINTIIKKNKLDADAVIHLLPPPILSHNIILKTVGIEPKTIEFYKLSSGEKQLIYSVNTILYHLINLDSIRSDRYQKGYRSINIILDEIELYFHPERQKQFINFLLKRIRELDYKKN